MRMNQSMRAVIGSSVVGVELVAPLEALAVADFVLELGAWLNATLAKSRANLRLSDYGDTTGYEAHVNHVYIDDFVRAEPAELVGHAVAFARQVAREWNANKRILR